jgi:hypothetical protein
MMFSRFLTRVSMLQLAENLIVVLTFRGGVGSYLAEEIVDGVGEVLANWE